MQIYYNFIPVQPSIFLEQESVIQRLNYNITIHNIISITGLPGSGKSSLAKAFIRQLQNQNNILWFEIENEDSDIILSLCNKLNELYNESFSNLKSPNLLLQVLTTLEKHKVIVVLDNLPLEQNNQLSSFFRRASKLLSTAKIVTTSTHQLSLPSIELTDVCEIQPKKLGIDSSEKLISQLCKMHTLPNIDKSSLKEISEICYGNPLALKTFISYVNQQIFSLDELYLKSSDFSKKMKEIIYQSLIENLSVKQKKILLLFQLYQHPLSRSLVHLTIGKNFQFEMQSLFSSLILEQNKDGLIQISPFINRYLDMRPSNEQLNEIHLSLSKLLLDQSLDLETLICASHHALLVENYDLVLSTLEYLANQIYVMGPELTAFQNLLHKVWSFKNCTQEVVLSYLIDSYLYLGHRQQAKSFIKQLSNNDLIAYYEFRDLQFDENAEQIIAAFKNLNINKLTLQNQIHANFLVSKYYFSIADTKSAKDCHKFAFELCTKKKDTFLVISTLHKLLHHFNFQEHILVRETLDRLFKLLQKHPNSKTYISCILVQASVLIRESNYLQSETILTKLIDSKSSKQFNEIIVRAHLLLASIYCIQTHYHKALHIYQLALNLAQNCHFSGLEAQILSHLSITYSRVNCFQEALESIEKAIQLANTVQKTKLLWLMNVQNIGLLILLNRIETALEKLEKSQKLQLLSNDASKTYLYFYYAKAYQVKKDQKSYKYYWQKYLTQFNSLDQDDQKSSEEARNWFESKILEINKYLLVNQSHQDTYSVNLIELRTICSDRLSFQVFFCSETKELFINQKQIDIFSKRILLPLLILFIQSPKAIFSSEEIINTVWEEPVSQKTKDKLRVTMLRLSKMLNNHGLEVLKNPNRNQFCFNDQLNYCLIFNENQ
ncbi:MAG: hypothetical protein KC646_13450 [Candidatus Cloacimonetes bacterium]|nr:hypothetical protein [Candidatus Cloacimonadota bacterium]